MDRRRLGGIAPLALFGMSLLLIGCGGDTEAPVGAAGGVAPAQCQLLGDIDGDGNPSVNDAIAILRIVVGLAEADPLADCDQDGATSVNDAILLLRCVVGLAEWPLGEICGIGTIQGYVIDTLSTAQDATALGFAAQTSDDAVAMAVVRVETGTETFYVRTMLDGYFAVEVPTQPVTLTAYPPEEQIEWYTPSAPLNVTTRADRLTGVEGTDMGPVPTVQPVEFMPLHLKDKRYMAVQDWTPDMIVPPELGRWAGVVIGTTTVNEMEAYVLASPQGAPDIVRTLQDEPTQFGDYSYIVTPGDDGSITIHGEAVLVRTPEGSYQVVACLYETPFVLVDLVLGREYVCDGFARQEVLDVQLAPGVTLPALYDEAVTLPGFGGCTMGIAMHVRVAAVGAPIETFAGDFSDTLVLEYTTEIDNGQRAVEAVQFRAWARDVGAVQTVGQRALRNVGEPRSDGTLLATAFRDLVYASVGGTEYGEAPPHRLSAFWSAIRGFVDGAEGPMVQWCDEYPTCDGVEMTLEEDGTLLIEFFQGATVLGTDTGTWTQVGNQLTINRVGHDPWVCTYTYSPLFLNTLHTEGGHEYLTEWFGA